MVGSKVFLKMSADVPNSKLDDPDVATTTSLVPMSTPEPSAISTATITTNATLKRTLKPTSVTYKNTVIPSLWSEDIPATTNTSTSSISVYIAVIAFLIFVVWRILRQTKLNNNTRTEDTSYMRVPQAEGDIEIGKLTRSIPQAGDDDPEQDNTDIGSWEEWDGPIPGKNDEVSTPSTSSRFQPLSPSLSNNSNGPTNAAVRAQQTCSAREPHNNVPKSKQLSPDRSSLHSDSAETLPVAPSAPAPSIYPDVDVSATPFQTAQTSYPALASAPGSGLTKKRAQPVPQKQDTDDLFASIGIAAKPKFVPPTAKVDPAAKLSHSTTVPKKPTDIGSRAGSLEPGTTMSRVQSLGGGSSTKASPQWDDAELVDELFDD